MKKRENPSPRDASRRNFLKASSVVAAGTLAGGMSIGRTAHAAGDDTIKIALIGCGGRGTGAASQALNTNSLGPVKIVAMADAFQNRLDGCLNSLNGTKWAKEGKVDVPKERQFVGLDSYKKAIATDCDMVILATPPGFRPLHLTAAVDAGKHVFMEKPVAVDSKGVREVLAAGRKAKEKNLAVAVGLQRRHEDRYRETIKRLQDGAIGDIILTRVYWNGGGVWTRPRQGGQTEMEYQVNNWYYFNWLCGDHIVEQHIHNLDVSNWLMNGYPVKAQGQGGRQVRTGKEHGQIYDHHLIEFTYANGAKMYSHCRHIPGCWNNVSEFAHGTKGTSNISGASISPTGGETWNFGRGGGGGHQQEHFNLFADLRAGKVPNEAEYGALSTMTSIFGRMATYSGQELSWDQALNSNVDAGVADFSSWDDTPPVTPAADGSYPIPMPGSTRVV